MARYAYLESGEIVEIHDGLPISWKNYSNFNLLDSAYLKELGWLPIVEPIEIPMYNSVYQTLEMKYIVREDFVEAYYAIAQWNPSTDAEIKSTYMQIVRDRRNSFLTGTDWTMLPDTAEVKGATWTAAWKNYRQQLRDFPSSFEPLQTSELPPIDDLQWPEPPTV